jgi:predicted MPP superfamily phosphohydrolase
LPEVFCGYRIAHISDLHNAQIGKDNEKLLRMLRRSKPNIIAITGDFIDSYHTDLEIALNFIRKAIKIAPCYYVPGDHEARLDIYKELKSEMEAAGVILLEDSMAEITLKGESITLIGVRDPSFKTDYIYGDSERVIREELSRLCQDRNGFTILLSHRPELFDAYADYPINLVLTGHAHGGQFRLPFVGGVVAPHQGFFPKYDKGIYRRVGTNMVVSCGLGNSAFPVRFNNPSELVVVELNKEW